MDHFFNAFIWTIVLATTFSEQDKPSALIPDEEAPEETIMVKKSLLMALMDQVQLHVPSRGLASLKRPPVSSSSSSSADAPAASKADLFAIQLRSLAPNSLQPLGTDHMSQPLQKEPLDTDDMSQLLQKEPLDTDDMSQLLQKEPLKTDDMGKFRTGDAGIDEADSAGDMFESSQAAAAVESGEETKGTMQ